MNPFREQITTTVSFRVETSRHCNIKNPKGIRLDSLIGRKIPIKALIFMETQPRLIMRLWSRLEQPSSP